MLATNPVDPRPISRLDILGPAGPHSPWPRKHDPAPFPVVKFLGIGALVLAGYVVLGTIGADATQRVAKVADPVAKAAPAVMTPVATPVPGDFRLAPGNNRPQGVVVRLGVAGAVSRRLPPRSRQHHAGGHRRGAARHDHPLHGAGRGIVPGRRLRASAGSASASARGRRRGVAEERRGELAGDPRVVHDQRDVRPDRRPVRDRCDAGEEPRRHGGAAHAGVLRLAERLLDRLARDRLVERVGLGHRVADDEPGLEAHRLVGADRPPPRHPRPARRSGPGSRSGASRSPGSRRCPTATTGTPRVSRYSSVSGTSRIAFGPGAHDRDRGPGELVEVRGDVEASQGRRCRRPSAPRWTPPMPPVANTRMPAAWAAIIVAATVVAPQPPDAIAAPRFGRDTLRTDPWGAVASASRPSAPSPTRSRPSLSATVAGTAPVERIACSEAVATSTFCG